MQQTVPTSATEAKRKGMGFGDALLVWLAIGFIVVFGGGTYAAAHLGSWMAGIEPLLPTRLT